MPLLRQNRAIPSNRSVAIAREPSLVAAVASGRRQRARPVPMPPMAIPLIQQARVGAYLARQRLARQEALSARADARAAVPLQPRVRRLRQDRLSRRDPEPAAVVRRLHGRDRRMRRADGVDRRRRAAAPSRHAAHREGVHGEEEVRHPLHQRAAAEEEDRRLRAVALLHVVDPPRRRQGHARQVGVPRRRVRHRARGDPAREEQAASARRSTARCSTAPTPRGSPRSSTT